MDKDTETNFGWWADKPEREGRPSAHVRPATEYVTLRQELRAREERKVWRSAGMVVALMLAFVAALVVYFRG